MNQPAEAEDAAGLARKAARAAAKLAEDTRPFHAFALGLRDAGLSVPAVMAHDPAQGFMLLEDLGHEICVAGDPPSPIPERYGAAVDALAHPHGRALAREIPDGTGGRYRIPAYGLDNLTAEVKVFLDWGFPHITGAEPTREQAESFMAAWAPLFREVLAGPETWCLRDYHSPNLIWMPDRAGIARVGVLDFQDTIFGHPAYDVASLAEDARVTVPRGLEATLVDRYAAARAGSGDFDETAFRRAYAILAAQRNTRILGVFARLLKRDGKPGYVRHLPRLWDYLDRAFADPVLSGVKLWYEAHVPADRRRPLSPS